MSNKEQKIELAEDLIEIAKDILALGDSGPHARNVLRAAKNLAKDDRINQAIGVINRANPAEILASSSSNTGPVSTTPLKVWNESDPLAAGATPAPKKKAVAEVEDQIIEAVDILQYTEEEIKKILGSRKVKGFAKSLGSQVDQQMRLSEFIDAWKIEVAQTQTGTGEDE